MYVRSFVHLGSVYRNLIKFSQSRLNQKDFDLIIEHLPHHVETITARLSHYYTMAVLLTTPYQMRAT